MAFARGDERPAAPLRQQVALGGELRVGLDDHAARDAELAGQRAGGRQAGAGRKAPDRGAERVLAAHAQRVPSPLQIEMEIHLALDYDVELALEAGPSGP